MFNEIAIDLWSSWNFICTKNIIKTYNLMVRFSKFTLNIEIYEKFVEFLFKLVWRKTLFRFKKSEWIVTNRSHQSFCFCFYFLFFWETSHQSDSEILEFNLFFSVVLTDGEIIKSSTPRGGQVIVTRVFLFLETSH